MARSPVSRGIKKRRHVLTYDKALQGESILTRVDVTLPSNNGQVVGTPITPLYGLRLVPSFNVPKRPIDITLRRLTICLTDGGTRTVYMPYTPLDVSHNAMIQEYLNLIPNDDYKSFRYRGEDFTL